MKPLIFGGLDLETTGLSQEKGDRIIEVALSMYRLDEIGADPKHLGNFVSRVNPERGIDPDATAVHGITFEELVHEPLWPVVGAKLVPLLERCDYVVAHNGEWFDAPFLLRELMRVGLPVPKLALIDTLVQGRWATPDGMSPSLKALAFACGVDYDTTRAHAALYDVNVMMACFFKQLARGFFKLPTSHYELPKLKAAA